MKYKAAIFDLDGTLLNSMDVWDKVDRYFFKSKKIPMPVNYSENINGLTLKETAKYTIELCGLSESPQELIDIWTEIAYNEYKNNIKLKSGAYEYLVYLIENGISLAIATACEKRLYEVCLKSNKIYDFFNVIVDTKEIPKGKDCPDIYLACAKKLNVSPKDCIVFEDILKAIHSVKKAGMKAYAVYDKHSQKDKEEILKYCDEYITDFRELINS